MQSVSFQVIAPPQRNFEASPPSGSFAFCSDRKICICALKGYCFLYSGCKQAVTICLGRYPPRPEAFLLAGGDFAHEELSQVADDQNVAFHLMHTLVRTWCTFGKYMVVHLVHEWVANLVALPAVLLVDQTRPNWATSCWACTMAWFCVRPQRMKFRDQQESEVQQNQ